MASNLSDSFVFNSSTPLIIVLPLAKAAAMKRIGNSSIRLGTSSSSKTIASRFEDLISISAVFS